MEALFKNKPVVAIKNLAGIDYAIGYVNEIFDDGIFVTALVDESIESVFVCISQLKHVTKV